MQHTHLQKIVYLTSATTIAQLPVDQGCEVAFVGRSNAGKSSALNAITGVNGLARTSQSPGRTQMINFFAFNNANRLVDLPGYGFAKVPKAVKIRWELLIHDYLEVRDSLKGLVLTMDIRHPLKELDLQIISWCVETAVPLHILLTKADKLTYAAQRNALKMVKHELVNFKDIISIQLFSALKCIGIDEARAKLISWL